MKKNFLVSLAVMIITINLYGMKELKISCRTYKTIKPLKISSPKYKEPGEYRSFEHKAYTIIDNTTYYRYGKSILEECEPNKTTKIYELSEKVINKLLDEAIEKHKKHCSRRTKWICYYKTKDESWQLKLDKSPDTKKGNTCSKKK